MSGCTNSTGRSVQPKEPCLPATAGPSGGNSTRREGRGSSYPRPRPSSWADRSCHTAQIVASPANRKAIGTVQIAGALSMPESRAGAAGSLRPTRPLDSGPSHPTRPCATGERSTQRDVRNRSSLRPGITLPLRRLPSGLGCRLQPRPERLHRHAARSWPSDGESPAAAQHADIATAAIRDRQCGLRTEKEGSAYRFGIVDQDALHRRPGYEGVDEPGTADAAGRNHQERRAAPGEAGRSCASRPPPSSVMNTASAQATQ